MRNLLKNHSLVDFRRSGGKCGGALRLSSVQWHEAGAAKIWMRISSSMFWHPQLRVCCVGQCIPALPTSSLSKLDPCSGFSQCLASFYLELVHFHQLRR